MTLCMAAACREKGELRIVAWADTRTEIDWAGANIAHKYDFVALPHWHALTAGSPSAAKDLAATCRTVLKPQEFTANNVLDKLNDAVCVHKEKLTERFVRKRLAMSFNRFLTKGEREVPSDNRTRAWNGIESLDFECSLIVMGFIDSHPHIYSISGEGDVDRRSNFAAIGSGSVVANSMLHYREQNASLTLDQTLYHLYEASLMAYHSKAPGVGGASQVTVYSPEPDGSVSERLGMSKMMIHLDLSFQKYGPKIVGQIPPLPDGCLITDEVALSELAKRLGSDG